MEFPHTLPGLQTSTGRVEPLSYKQKKVDEANKYKGEFLTDYLIYF